MHTVWFSIATGALGVLRAEQSMTSAERGDVRPPRLRVTIGPSSNCVSKDVTLMTDEKKGTHSYTEMGGIEGMDKFRKQPDLLLYAWGAEFAANEHGKQIFAWTYNEAREKIEFYYAKGALHKRVEGKNLVGAGMMGVCGDYTRTGMWSITSHAKMRAIQKVAARKGASVGVDSCPDLELQDKIRIDDFNDCVNAEKGDKQKDLCAQWHPDAVERKFKEGDIVRLSFGSYKLGKKDGKWVLMKGGQDYDQCILKNVYSCSGSTFTVNYEDGCNPDATP